MTETRVCRTCGVGKPASAEFFYVRRRPAGPDMNTQCIDCFKAAKRARDRADPGKRRSVARKSYHKPEHDGRAKGLVAKERARQANPALYAQISDRYETANAPTRKAKRKSRHLGAKDENNAASRQWYREHRDRAIETSLAWQRANPIEAAANRLKVRANRAKAPGTDPTVAELRARLVECSGRCTYCGVGLEDATWTTRSGRTRPLLEWEHCVPLSRGGSRSIENVVPACKPCNRRKWAWMPSEFLSHPTTA